VGPAGLSDSACKCCSCHRTGDLRRSQKSRAFLDEPLCVSCKGGIICGDLFVKG